MKLTSQLPLPFNWAKSSQRWERPGIKYQISIISVSSISLALHIVILNLVSDLLNIQLVDSFFKTGFCFSLYGSLTWFCFLILLHSLKNGSFFPFYSFNFCSFSLLFLKARVSFSNKVRFLSAPLEGAEAVFRDNKAEFTDAYWWICFLNSLSGLAQL